MNGWKSAGWAKKGNPGSAASEHEKQEPEVLQPWPLGETATNPSPGLPNALRGFFHKTPLANNETETHGEKGTKGKDTSIDPPSAEPMKRKSILSSLEEDLLQRQKFLEPLTDDELDALDLLERRRKGQSLSRKEQDELDRLSKLRQEELESEENILRVEEGEGLKDHGVVYGDDDSKFVPWQNQSDGGSHSSLSLDEILVMEGEEEENKNIETSMISMGHRSYLEDLLDQRESRDERRTEEIMEDALTLYDKALKAQGLPENTELFKVIFRALLEENAEKILEEDRIHDERIEKAKLALVNSKNARKNQVDEVLGRVTSLWKR